MNLDKSGATGKVVETLAKGSHFRLLVRSLFRVILTAYGIALILLYLFQTWLIFPGRYTKGIGASKVTPPPGTELVPLQTSGGDKVVALYGPALDPAGLPIRDSGSRSTLLYFYGNASCINSSLGQFEEFRRLGANVLIPEYAGYGMSSGKPSEAGCYATADAAYDYLLTRRDVDPKKIVAAGWSLGGGVAIDLASRRPVGGLATFCTFSSMTDMARRKYPYVPVSRLLRHRFESERKIKTITCPILLGHGETDARVPYFMRDRLAEAAGGPVTRFSVKDAGHNDFFEEGSEQIRLYLGRLLKAIDEANGLSEGSSHP
jgi:pimeloyl-ACP methyl ester carboxylesterase